tara:strand:- start:130 stop:492 length:363 start_codon:yes stop_codon:yes gene_type:complete
VGFFLYLLFFALFFTLISPSNMTMVPDITLQFLKWRYQNHHGAKRAHEWVRENMLHAHISTLEMLGEQQVGVAPEVWCQLHIGIVALSRQNERLTSSLMVYATMRHSLYFLARLSRRKRS